MRTERYKQLKAIAKEHAYYTKTLCFPDASRNTLRRFFKAAKQDPKMKDLVYDVQGHDLVLRHKDNHYLNTLVTVIQKSFEAYLSREGDIQTDG